MEALRTFENLSDAEKLKFFEALTKPKGGSQQDASTSSTPSLEQTSPCSVVPNLTFFIEQLAKQTIAESENPAVSSSESKAKQKTLDGWLIKKSSSTTQQKTTDDCSKIVSPVASKKSTTDTQTVENHTHKSTELVNAKKTDLSAGGISQSRKEASQDDSIEVPKKEFLDSLSLSPEKNKVPNSNKKLKQKGIKKNCELGAKSFESCAPKKPKKSDLVTSPSSSIAASKTVSDISSSSNHLDSLSNNNASAQDCSVVNPFTKKQSIAPKLAKFPSKSNKNVANDLTSSDLISCSSFNDISNDDISLKQICSKTQDSLLSSSGPTYKKPKKSRKLKKVISNDNNIVHQEFDLISKSVDDSLNYNSKSFIDESVSEDHDLNAGKKVKVKSKSFSGVPDTLVLLANKKSESIKKAKSLPNVISINYNLSSNEVSKLELDDKSLNKKSKLDTKPKQSSKSKGVLKDDHLAKDSPKKQISKVSNKPLKTPPKRSIDGKSKSVKTDASVSFDLPSKLSSDIVKSYSTIENVINSVASGQYVNEANLSQQNKSISSEKTRSNCTSKTDIPSADDNISSSCIPESSCDKLRSDLSGSTVNDPNETNEKEETVKITKADRKSKSIKIISPPIPAPTVFSPFELLGLQQKSADDEIETHEDVSIATAVTQKEMLPTNKRVQLGVKPKVLSDGPYFQESPPKQHSKTFTLNSPPNDIVSEPNINKFPTSLQNKKSYNLRGKRKFTNEVLDSIETEGTACKKPRIAAGAKRIISDQSADTNKQELISSKDVAQDYDTFSSEESDYQVFIRISNLCSEHGLNIHDLLTCKGVQNFLSQSTVDDTLENAVILISGHVSNDGQMIPVANMHSDRLILTEKLLEILHLQKS